MSPSLNMRDMMGSKIVVLVDGRIREGADRLSNRCVKKLNLSVHSNNPIVPIQVSLMTK